jgi:hypothetical protein
MIRFSLLPLGEDLGEEGRSWATRHPSPLPNPLPKGEGVRRKKFAGH